MPRKVRLCFAANEAAVARGPVPRRCRKTSEEKSMNWDRIEGKWKQSVGKVKEHWGKLTDDDLDLIAGKRDQLVGRIQERYGIARDAAEQQVDDFVKSY